MSSPVFTANQLIEFNKKYDQPYTNTNPIRPTIGEIINYLEKNPLYKDSCFKKELCISTRKSKNQEIKIEEIDCKNPICKNAHSCAVLAAVDLFRRDLTQPAPSRSAPWPAIYAALGINSEDEKKLQSIKE